MIQTGKTLLTLAALCMGGLTAGAQSLSISSSSPKIEENFDSMWDSSSMENVTTQNLNLPAGWRIDVNATGPRQVGSWETLSDKVQYTDSENLLSNQANGGYCWGDSNNVSDRAIGGLSTGSTTNTDGKSRGTNVVTKITNSDQSKILTNLDLSYNIEKYRTGNNNAGFSIRIYTSNDGNRWTEADNLVTSFDPDATTEGAAVVPISVTKVNNVDLRVHVEPGEDIYLAWNISVTSGNTCSGAPGYAVDDIVINGVFSDTDDDFEEEPEFVASGIYLRGIGGSWDVMPEWEFSKLSDNEFVLYNKTVSGTFKVADANWSSYNYGSNGENITMNVPYVLKSGTDTNISCGNLSFTCSRILLTIDNGEAMLTLEPNVSTAGLTSVYMVGDFNDWNYMSTSGRLSLDSSDNLFKGEVALSAGPDGLSHWMIYQRLALAGAWGLDQDADVSSLSGILKAGETGHPAVNPGMYNITFNLETGEYNLELLASKAESLALSPGKVTLVPGTPEKVKVLSLNNSLIHYNDQAKVFNDIAESMNKDACWTKHTNLGKTLQYHWEEGDGMTDAGEPGAKMMIRSDVWSHIILQEQTILPRTDFESFRNSVAQWVDYIRTSCPNPNAVIIVPLNWALGQDWSNFTEFNKTLVENYNKVAQEYGVVICPVGLAYQSKFEKDGGQNTETDWFLPGDDRHPTLKATYLAALMEYGIIYDEDPRTVAYYPNYTTEYDAVGEMSDDIAKEMREYAYNALSSYKNVVDHHNATINFNATVLDQYGLEMNNEQISWSVEPSTASISNGVFVADQMGEYVVKAEGSGFTSEAIVNVTEAVTEMPDFGQISLSENNLEYSQDFNSMGNAEEAEIPDGWRADVQLTPRTVGAYQTASQTTLKAGGVNFGSSAKNGVWNLGDSSDESDRALGGITTDVEGGAKSINVYAAFRNDGNKYISSIGLDYNVEKYRDGSNAAGFTVQLFTSQDGRNWKNAGDDFAVEFEPSSETIGSDIVPMDTRHIVGELNYEMAPGAELYLAWNISASSGESCMSAPVLAIDDVNLKANLRPVPTYEYHIYIENNSGYEKTGLYAWSENEPSEIFGSWPGQNPIDIVEIEGVAYEVFGHNQPTGTYHLIFNNNNNGSQYNDYDIEGGSDYYLRATSDGKTLEPATTVNDNIEIVKTDVQFVITDSEIILADAVYIEVFNDAGISMAKCNRSSLNISNLAPGLYIAVAATDNVNITRKFLKK